MRRTQIVALLIVFFTAAPFAQAQRNKATQVFVHEVQTQSFSKVLEALGTLNANEAATLSSTVTETVTAIHFDDGQRVAKGDVLVEMTSNEETALLQSAQHRLVEAEQQYRRVQTLVKEKLATQSELDARKLAYDSAVANLAATRSRLADLLVIAPFDGVVGLRNISPGALVRPGNVITTIDDDSIMKLDMQVPSRYLRYLSEGMAITGSTPALGDMEFVGEISSIGSRIDPITRSVAVRAHIPNPDRILKPGLMMVVELQEPERDVVLIPEKALILRAAGRYVFVVGPDNTAEQRRVQIGERKPGVVEISEGLAPGEKIVTHGHLKLKQGSAVEVVAVDSGSDSLKSLLGNR
jgi:membrane fusion protein (multidrug efflux system)